MSFNLTNVPRTRQRCTFESHSPLLQCDLCIPQRNSVCDATDTSAHISKMANDKPQTRMSDVLTRQKKKKRSKRRGSGKHSRVDPCPTVEPTSPTHQVLSTKGGTGTCDMIFADIDTCSKLPSDSALAGCSDDFNCV